MIKTMLRGSQNDPDTASVSGSGDRGSANGEHSGFASIASIVFEIGFLDVGFKGITHGEADSLIFEVGLTGRREGDDDGLIVILISFFYPSRRTFDVLL